MPLFAVVPMDDAQRKRAPTKSDLLLKEYQEYIDRVGTRQAGKLTADPGESAAAVRRRIGAAAKASGVSLQIRRTEDAVYFWRGSRRGRPRSAVRS